VTDRVTDLNDPTWQQLFTGLQSSWFRLETLQQYDVDYESTEFQDFLRSGVLDREPGEWQNMISQHVQQGRRLQRVHVVTEPLSDYVRYEIAAYEHNQRAGEEIRLIPTQGASWPKGLPRDHDYWLFDDRDAWQMVYDPSGRFIAAERVTDPAAIERCRRWRDSALDQSIPLDDYTYASA
jgi:hypothetical protein